MLYGFWEKPKTFELKVRESSISKLEHRVELSNSLIDAKVNRANSLIDELEKRKVLQKRRSIQNKRAGVSFLILFYLKAIFLYR